MAQPAGDPVIEGYRTTEVASVSDAMEQLYGQQTFLSHEMRPLEKTKFAGPAWTVLMKKEEIKEGGGAAVQVMLDAIDTVTGSKTLYRGMPDGTRAVQLPDNQFASYFLSVFGRPDAASPCECERNGESNLAQSLYLFNSEELLEKIRGKKAPDNPWGAASLEWQTSTPPITSNFHEVPKVHDPYEVHHYTYDPAVEGYVRKEKLDCSEINEPSVV